MPEVSLQADGRSLEHKSESEWSELIGRFCPIAPTGSIWRLNRLAYPEDPDQGWKIHVSATILEACEVFKSVVDFLTSKDLQFKVPKSLRELALINSGLGAGYSQVGKFLTVYPRNDSDAVDVAHELHELTLNSTSISVPFDRQYCAGSNVHMRYGAFAMLEVLSNNGQKMPAIRDSDGNLVPDDRLTIAPAWVKDPFPVIRSVCNGSFADTPLGERYRAFAAISQRGKGGVYLAVDLTDSRPRTCVVKQGRKNGEIGWDGQDGLFRVKTELRVLSEIGGKIAGVPAIYDSFEVNGSFYLVLEHVRGMNLESSLLSRRRRMSIGSIVSHSIEVCELLRSLHNSGWVWGDCKPANLVRSPAGALRPIDFEGAYRISEPDPYRWRTKGFSDGPTPVGGAGNDLFSLGATMYFLLTGRVYDAQLPVAIQKRRKRVPKALVKLTMDLLESRCVTASDALERLLSLGL